MEFLNEESLLKLGFEKISNNYPNCYEYQNNGTIHYNSDYSKYPEPKGKVILKFKTDYTTLSGIIVPYIEILQDGGTRKVYQGLCPTEHFLLLLLFNIR